MFRRLLWHVNRSPARHAIKAAMRMLHAGQVKARRDGARGLERTAPVLAASGSLRRDGYARVDDLIPLAAREQLADAVRIAAEAPRGGPSVFGTHKDIWTSVVDGQMVEGQLPSDHVFTRFALQPAVVAALADYYGELPRLDYVTVTRSLHTGSELRFSQLWHRDYDDTCVVKLFVYLTDVDSVDDGPFTFLPAAASRRVKGGLKSHRQDTSLGAELDEAMRMTGPRLSCFLVETSRCYHMGSRVSEGHERIMFTATYISTPRIYPERAKNFFAPTGAETPVEQHVLFPG